MRILTAEIIRITRNRGFILKKFDDESTISARSIWKNGIILKHPSHNKALILKIGDQYSLLGNNPVSCNNYTEYKAGKNFILRHYDNSNLTIYPIAHGALGLSVLNFTFAPRKLIFDSSVFCIHTKKNPAYYLTEIDDHTTIVWMLISAGKFADLCSVPRETLRRWKLKKKLIPVKTTRSGYAFYSFGQIPIAKKLASRRASSVQAYRIIMNSIGKIQPNEVLYFTYFKNLIPGYSNSTYSTLRMVIQELLSKSKLERIKRGYYAVIPENKK